MSREQALEIVADAFRQTSAGDAPTAVERLPPVLDWALDTHDAALEAEARRAMGHALARLQRVEEATAHLERGVEVARAAGLHRLAGSLLQALGGLMWQRERPRARGLYEQALAEYEAAGAQDDQAETLRNLALSTGYTTESVVWIERARELTAHSTKVGLRARVLQTHGDFERLRGDFRGAWEALHQAEQLLAGGIDDVALRSIYLSLGLLTRQHGYPEQALEYHRRALELSRRAGDPWLVSQGHGAVARALLDLGRANEALAAYDEAVAIARAAGLGDHADTLQQGYGFALLELDRPQEARPHLEAGAGYAERMGGATMAQHLNSLVILRLALGDPQAALTAAHEALRLMRSQETRGLELAQALSWRGLCLKTLGRLGEAEADASEATQVIEEMRARLVPDDLLRSGFAETTQDAFGLRLEIESARRESRAAFETAERARARALLDALASRQGTSGDHDAARHPPAAATLKDAGAAARRLQSTVVAYFVGVKESRAWVVTPDGRVRDAAIPAGRNRLAALVQRTRAFGAGPSRGVDDVLELPTRAGGLVRLGRAPSAAWSELHQLLVEPLLPLLPAARGSRLTIVPHGPLFELSFAALRDPRGRYLIERHALHYAPSVGVLAFTGPRAAALGERPLPPLVVGDPERFPQEGPAPALPPLPAARVEAEGVARTLKAGSDRLLLGPRANEEAVRRLGASAGLLHLATHAVVNLARPLESYLALRPETDTPANDGRLTVSDIYGLDLPVRFAFLSACRTAIGRPGSEGMIGLLRAFLFAGVPSVAATVWDIPDEPSAALVEHFYRELRVGDGRDRALRRAQVRLLRDLRAGQVRAAGRARPLPEDPALWASFVLVGEP